ncbi:MAG: hypothetical protein Q9178_005748 [Gyalolechia marmorata]
MDPLLALGLAGNVVQLVHFGSILITGTLELYTSIDGAKKVNRELEVLTEDLTRICAKATDPQNKTSVRDASDSEIALVTLFRSCHDLGQELLEVLQSLKVKDPRHKWTTFRQALRSAWKQSKIHEYEKRLGQYRSQITTHLITILSQIATGYSDITGVLDEMAANYQDFAVSSLYTGTQILDGQSSIAKVLDNLAASHRRLEVTSTNTVATLRKDILDTLEGLRLNDNKKNQNQIHKPHVEQRLAFQISALMSEAQNLSRELKVIKSLKFSTISERRTRIRDAHPNTFEWLFDETISNDTVSGAEHIAPFLAWLENKTGVYWLGGKAGSGKSTLMKFLDGHEKTRSALRYWAGSKTLVTASFFFWNLGVDMQKSQEGLLQTLLYHVLRQVPSLIRIVCPVHWNNDGFEQPEWTRPEILKTLHELRKHTFDTTRFCFFIDGLDEYEGTHGDIIELINSFTSGGDIKIVISSRPWDVFEDAYGNNSGQSLRLQDLTRNDIACFVRDDLEKDQHFRQLKLEDRRYEDFVQEIVERASGVFLWVFLVVRSLRRGFSNADTVGELQERLRILPTELEVYFGHMMSTVEKVYHKQAARILLICFHAPTILTVMTASKFDEEDISFGLATKSQPLDAHEYTQRVKITSRRIKARCTDLLEVRANRVNYLHRTVYEFLDLPDTRRILYERAGNDFDADIYLCNAMLYQIKTLPAAGGNRYLQQPIGDLVNNFMFYAEGLDFRTKLDHRLLDDLIRPVEFYRRLNITYHQNTWYSLYLDDGCQEGWIIALALNYGIDGYIRVKSKYVQRLIKKKAYVNEHSLLAVALRLNEETEYRSPDNRTPINPCVVATLLELGADPNECPMGLPTWCVFLSDMPKSLTPEKRRAYITIAELLLRNGAVLSHEMYSGLKVSLFRSCSFEEATYLLGLIEKVIENRNENGNENGIGNGIGNGIENGIDNGIENGTGSGIDNGRPGNALSSIKKYFMGMKKKR